MEDSPLLDIGLAIVTNKRALDIGVRMPELHRQWNLRVAHGVQVRRLVLAPS